MSLTKLISAMAFVGLLAVAGHGQTHEPVSPSDFTEEALAALREVAPDYVFSAVSDLEINWSKDGGKPGEISLRNIYANHSADPQERNQALQSFARLLLEPAQDDFSPEDQSRILVVIKSGEFHDHAGEKIQGIVSEKFLSGLWLMFVVDFPDRVQFLKREDLAGLGVKPEDLRALAVRNLAAMRPGIVVEQVGPLFMARLEGTYESSFLLVDDFWTRMHSEFEIDPVAAIPTRDLLLFADREDKEAVRILRERASEFSQEGGYAITDDLYRRIGGTWKTEP